MPFLGVPFTGGARIRIKGEKILGKNHSGSSSRKEWTFVCYFVCIGSGCFLYIVCICRIQSHDSLALSRVLFLKQVFEPTGKIQCLAKVDA
jgi:hypothetical protein